MLPALEFLRSSPAWAGDGDFDIAYLCEVLELLGSPQESYPSIHVSGTNGKGSVAVYCAAIMAASGKRVGLTVSPHLCDEKERIVIDGRPIAPALFDSSMNQVQQACAESGRVLSYFEVIIATAFVAFSVAKVEIAVLEVGLGGRRDATNVSTKTVATVVTTISFDHEAILGSKLSEIAHEKAGILRPGVPMVIGDLPREAREVVYRESEKVGAPISRLGRDFSVKASPSGFEFKSNIAANQTSFLLSPGLLGEHQGANAALAAQVGCLLGVSSDDIRRGVASAYWPARLEWREIAGKRVLFDCCHNTEGIGSLLCYLKQQSLDSVQLCFGVLATKRWKEMVALLSSHVRQWLILEPRSAMRVEARAIAQEVSGFGISSVSFGGDYDSFQSWLIDEYDPQSGPLVVAGSIYMIGEVLRRNGGVTRGLWMNNT